MLRTVTSPVSVSTSTSATVQAWASVESGSMAPVSGSTSLFGFMKLPRPAIVRPYLNCASDAMSAIFTERAGTPRTTRFPWPSISRSSTAASSSSAATSSSAWRASVAAAITALPTRWVARLANVPMSCGPVSVSAVSTTTSSNATPSVSAAIWPITVRKPWPEVGGGQGDDERPAGRRVDEGLRRVAAEVHAGRVVDRGDPGAAQLRHR